MPYPTRLADLEHAGMDHQPFTPPNNPIGKALRVIADPEYWKSVMQTAPNSLGQLAKGMAADIVGAPVDIANIALQPFGLGSEKPVMGSDYLGEAMNADTKSAPFRIGTIMPLGPDDIAQGLPLIAGMFAGKAAKTADLSKLALAEKMADSGIADDVIHKTTGWFKGMPDKKWRFEIPDDAASLKLKYKGRSGIESSGSISNGLEHKDLYSAYPETAKIQASISQGDFPERGSYSSREIDYHEFMPQLTAQGKDAKSPVLHELQHAIQQREGFARGGSVEELARRYKAAHDEYDLLWQTMQSNPQNRTAIVPELDKLRKEYRDLANPNDAYRRLAGEAEARLTQARMNMNAQQRAASYPPSMFDVPVEQQIVRYGDDAAQSVPTFGKYKMNPEVGGEFPDIQGVSRRPNKSIVAAKDNPYLTLKTLPDGRYQANYLPAWGVKSKEFSAIGDDPNELLTASLNRINKSDKAISAAEKSKRAKSLGGMLENEFGDVFEFASSARSKSEYITHKPSGLKIRISDHKLPLGYEGADLDVPIGATTEEKLKIIRDFLGNGE